MQHENKQKYTNIESMHCEMALYSITQIW